MTDGIDSTAGGQRRFDVLVVCTANLCRSPMVEAMIRFRLAELPGAWTVGSAGVEAVVDRPMHPFAERALIDLGVPVPAGWRSQAVTSERIGRADLVLTATRAHRAEVVSRHPRAARSVFTLRQFARLVSVPDVEPAPGPDRHPGSQLLARALAARGTVAPPRPGDDDIPDPIGHPLRVYTALSEELLKDVDTVTAPIASFR